MEKIIIGILIGALVMTISLIPLARKKKKTPRADLWRTIVLGILMLAAAIAMFYPGGK